MQAKPKKASKPEGRVPRAPTKAVDSPLPPPSPPAPANTVPANTVPANTVPANTVPANIQPAH